MTYEDALKAAIKNAPNPIVADQLHALLLQHQNATPGAPQAEGQ